jgi:signal transduction histidine kinase/ActR/RegA family two-component response regulator
MAKALFNDAAWSQALQKFGAVTGLTVVVYGRDGGLAREAINVTPLFSLFQSTGYQPGIFADCAQQCLAQIVDRPAVVVAPSYGLAVVGTSLVLAGEIVGAAVAGYAFIDFCTTSAVELLARQAGVPFDRVWSVARITAPLPQRRLVVHGELLQVLGDVILRENERTRQFEEKSAELAAAAAAKDNFLAVISHELRTPLTPILLRAQLLAGERDPARIDQSAMVIERNVRLQVRLVEDLLDLSRTRRGSIRLAVQNLDLGSETGVAVHSALETARQRDITLRLVAAEEPLPVKADRDRLQQILQNIIGNAIKFTPAGGTITVTAAPSDGSGTVGIVDTGQGITPEFLPFVFEMFRREQHGADPGPPGLGIGLALVRRLVELHGGDIQVSSAGPGHGTTVLLRLPLVGDAPTAAPSHASADRRSHTLAGLRILVVEDADEVRATLQLLLESLGAHVDAAGDGLEGLTALASKHPDVVLCDVQMPRLDGFEFVQRLHADRRGPQPPVIAMTGAGSESERSRTAAAGFTAHLEKPIDEHDLILAIESALGQRSNP